MKTEDQQKTEFALSLWEKFEWHTGVMDQSGVGAVRLKDHESLPGKTLTGNTRFFRHMSLYNHALDCAHEFHEATGEPATIMCAGGSIGAEAYSLAFETIKRGYEPWLRIATFDLSSRFTAVAEQGIYPIQMGLGLWEIGKSGFIERYGPRHIRVADHFRALVDVLPSRSFLSPEIAELRGDVTVSVRALMYLSNEDANHARAALGAITAHSLITDRFFDPNVIVEGFKRVVSNDDFDTLRRVDFKPSRLMVG